MAERPLQLQSGQVNALRASFGYIDRLLSAEIVLEAIAPDKLRGYGALSATEAATLDAILARIRAPLFRPSVAVRGALERSQPPVTTRAAGARAPGS